MSANAVSGVYAAVLTPRYQEGHVDAAELRTLVEFLMEHGITAFAMNGATGEFCLTTPAELRLILRTVHEASRGEALVLCGIGAAGSAHSIELAEVAGEAGVHGLLLPMPFFFPYQQEDLDLFCRIVAAATPLPILLYNLPQFTSGLEKETVRTLISEVPNIIGIKDSSGSLEILRELTTHSIDACRIIGNDSALAPAMLEGLCDGVVSGVACALPEVIVRLYGELHRPNSSEFQHASARLEEFIDQLNRFPTPWGLKWACEARGLLHASFAQPVSPHRLAQAAAMQTWLQEWLPSAQHEPSFSNASSR